MKKIQNFYFIALKTLSIRVIIIIDEQSLSKSYGGRRKNMKKFLSVFAALAMCVLGVTALTSCDSGKYDVYYLNFKPEADGQWQEVAKKYKEETGKILKVVTAANGKYEETLTAEMEKSKMPTLFQVNGSVGYEKWKNYCGDFTGSDFLKELTSEDFAIKDGDKTVGVAYVYEGYGIVANKTLLSQAGVDVATITSFETLKAACEKVTAAKKAGTVNFSAFTSNTLDGSSSWRFSGHLANVALSYEFAEKNITAQPATIEFKYAQNFRNIWDLYVNNSTVEPSTIATGKDAAAEFANAEAAFYQNGTWCYGDIVKENGKVKDADLAYLPIYLGVKDEKEGLACGTENFWAFNKTASEQQQKDTLDFLYWMVTSETGTKALADDMGFVSPFKKAKSVKNTLCNLMNEYTAKGCYNVAWTAMNLTPNTEAWRADVVDALTAYTIEQTDANYAEVKKAFVDGWAKQYTESHK